MSKTLIKLLLILISLHQIVGCSTSKSQLFNDDKPTMKEIHDKKFNVKEVEKNSQVKRNIKNNQGIANEAFQWLPNPTLNMYVFKHLTRSGHGVPGYTTFFKLYATDHVAFPGEAGGWE